MTDFANVVNVPIPGSPRFQQDTTMAISRLRASLGPSGTPSFSTIALPGLAGAVVRADTDGILQTVTIGSSLSYAAPTLNTIQGIRTADSPEFAGLTLTGFSGAVKATAGVLAGGATLDDVADGVSYERVAAAELSSGIYKNATTAIKGIASFSATNFTVTDGAVSLAAGGGLAHSTLSGLDYASAGHTGFEPTVTKGNLTAGSTKISIGGTGTGALIGAGASVDVAEGNLTHNNIGGLQGGTAGEYNHLTNAQISALHAEVTLGTANGLSLVGQQLSLPTTATPTFLSLILTDRLTVNSGSPYLTRLGYLAGSSVTGTYNTLVGYKAGEGTGVGFGNNACGAFALNANTAGEYNNGMGYAALFSNTSGIHNNAMGYASLYNMVPSIAGDSSYNSAFGAYSGFHLTTGQRNVFFGYQAGYNQTTNSDLLIIDNRDRTNAAGELANSLLYGVFAAAAANQSLRINGEILGSDGAKIGDGGTTNYAQFAADGELTLAGTARTNNEFELTVESFSPGASGASSVVLGNYSGWSFGIGDDVIATFEIPHDWDSSTALTIYIYWYINEAYATGNGEVQWQATWSATPPSATEAVDAPAHSGTLDFGDQNIPATAKFLTETSGQTIAAASLSAGDLIGLTISRVALDAGSNPTAEPVLTHVEVHYISNKLGEAT